MRPTVSSRLLSLLDAFTPTRPVLTLSELARAADLPLSTAHRLLAELEAWGGVARGADGRYRMGLKLWELGSLAPLGLPLREVALPFMEDLYEATHENVQLSVLEGGQVVYVERLAGRDAVRTLVRVGGRFAPHATAGGLVLLAHAPAEQQEEVLAGPLTTFTPHTVTDSEALRRVLAEVRRQGYSVSDRQVTDDAISVGAPIRGAHDTVIAALSVVVPVDAMEHRELIPLVLAGARGISRTLGSPWARRATGAVRFSESPQTLP